MEHLKTPPNATSSPKTTAFSSVAKAMLIASRIAWYVFILRVSRPPIIVRGGAEADSSAQLMPGVRRAVSRLVFRISEVAMDGKCPPAGGGSTVELHLCCGIEPGIRDLETLKKEEGCFRRSMKDKEERVQDPETP